MNPQIQALFDLQKRDRQLHVLERKLDLIPKRLVELDEDMKKLAKMLEGEQKKCEDTRAFQRTHERALAEEEEMLKNSRAKMGQVKNPRELSAIQREIESTRRMANTRTEEINKIKAAVEETETKLEGMRASFEDIRGKADAEAERLRKAQTKLEAKLAKLETNRKDLKGQVELDTIRTYERIRKRVGGMAFVAASEGRCTACKMHVPHQTFVALRKGEEIHSCESCGRLLFWKGLFPEDEATGEPKAKAAPEKRAAKASPSA
ncbi:MAG: zinc ribbon domain-containing protein [Nannocystaceae bacterium]|nr:C4-type zinc ribbon domain-containing protein [bacterium]